jgi:hypothetical protein
MWASNGTVLLRLDPIHLALQTFAGFPMQLILFFQLLHAPAQLRVPSKSFRQLVALPHNCRLSLFVFPLKVPRDFFQPWHFAPFLLRLLVRAPIAPFDSPQRRPHRCDRLPHSLHFLSIGIDVAAMNQPLLCRSRPHDVAVPRRLLSTN